MTEYQPLIELRINSEPFLFWTDISVRRALNEVSTLDFTVPNRSGGFTPSFGEGQLIELFATYSISPVKFWEGQIDKITYDSKRTSDILVWCRDPVRIYERERTVDDDFESYPQFTGLYEELMGYMNTQVSAPLTLNKSRSTSDFQIVKQFGYERTLDEFTKAAEFGNYEWFYSGQQQALIVREPKALIESNVVKDYILGNPDDFASSDLSNFAFLTSDTVTEDYSDQYTRVRADGANGLFSVYPLTQVANPRELRVQNNEWTTQQAVDIAAQNLYNQRRFPRTSIDIKPGVGQENREVSDIIRCDDAFYGLSKLTSKIFRIIAIVDTFNKQGWNTDFELGDFRPTLVDFL